MSWIANLLYWSNKERSAIALPIMQKPYFNSAVRVLTIAFCALYFQPSLADTLHGRVVSISDGDTLTLLDASNQQFKIRLTGIDAPEKKQPFGQVSKQQLSAMVFGKSVTVEWFKKDRYQRTLGKIVLDGLDINLKQVKSGMAWHYKKYEKEQPPEDRQTYAEAETNAQQKRLGLWADANAVPPWEFRHR